MKGIITIKMFVIWSVIIFIVDMFLSFSPVSAQFTYIPSKENLTAREWLRNAKFGMFIHWGVYCILGDAEWVMQNQDIPVSEYERLMSFFNPIEFSAEEWVSIAKAAGMKYITITTKHHDGFAMYDSKVSDYDIVDSTPYGKDIFHLLEQECKKQGIKLFAYYSQLDWHHPDYYPRGWTGRKTGRPESGDWEKYLAYQDAQIKELVQNYDIAGFWFDGWWDQRSDSKGWLRSAKYRIKGNDWYLQRTYQMIHDIKPKVLIGNNHHVVPFEGEDFQMFEKDLPGGNTAGFNTTEISPLPLETCETINGSWGFRLNDKNYKSVKDLIHYLVNAAGRNANFLLNVGPMPNGKIQPEFVERLLDIGRWLEKYGKTIYGTRGGPFNPGHWGVSTRKGDKIYLHILNRDNETLALSRLSEGVKNARLFKDKSEVQFTENDFGILLRLPEIEKDEADLIIEIEISGK